MPRGWGLPVCWAVFPQRRRTSLPYRWQPQPPKAHGKLAGTAARCYYDADGTPVTGEVTIDGTAYLFDYTGTQKTGWRTVDGERRYYDPETGELVLGWVESGGYRYYTDDSGLKETGEQEIDGHRYSFSETYGMQDTGIHAFSDGSLSYYNVEGEIQTGWQTDGNSSYYFSEDTETALLGLQEIDGALYYFGGDGKLDLQPAP